MKGAEDKKGVLRLKKDENYGIIRYLNSGRMRCLKINATESLRSSWNVDNI